MRMAVIFGMNQIVSHGFGLFLFAALVPLMAETLAITHWHLAVIGALTQLSYLAGALMLGLIGHRYGSDRLALMTGTTTTVLLFMLSMLRDPLVIALVLSGMAASAAVSWGCIVEIVSRYVGSERRSSCLSSAASGTAWGYGLNGLLILLVVPAFGWQSGWLLAGLIGMLVVALTRGLLRGLKGQSPTGRAVDEPAIPVRKLLKTIIGERTALFACIISLLVGFTTIPFTTWLNTWLDQLGLPAALGGYSWMAAGLVGMVAGFTIGKLADRKGHSTTLVVIFSGFSLGMLALILDPTTCALLAGAGYGLMYFPVWGILASWIGQHYSSTVTMRINSLCMVAAGLGGGLGNLTAGYISDIFGSLYSVYILLTACSVLLLALALYIRITSPGNNQLNSLLIEESCREAGA